jgi:hypothetical protein
MEYVRTVGRRQVARDRSRAPGAEDRRRTRNGRYGASPERSPIENQFSEMGRRILSGLRGRDREIRSRFFAEGRERGFAGRWI